MNTQRKTLIIITSFLFAWTIVNSWWSCRYSGLPSTRQSGYVVRERPSMPVHPQEVLEREEQQQDKVEPAVHSPSSISLSSAPPASTIPVSAHERLRALSSEYAIVDETVAGIVTLYDTYTDEELVRFAAGAYAICMEMRANERRYGDARDVLEERWARDVIGGATTGDVITAELEQLRTQQEKVALDLAEKLWLVAEAVWPGRDEPRRMDPWNQRKKE
jgi:hypothetical protein